MAMLETELTPEIDVEDPLDNLSERQLKQLRALEIVQAVAEMVGESSIKLSVLSGVEDITEETMSQPGIYWLQPTERNTDHIDGATFDFSLSDLSGAADSAHAVLPGKLSITGNNQNTFYDVVAKCYVTREHADRADRALRELRFMQDMGELGELTTLPLALVVAPHSDTTSGEIVLLTKLNPTLKTLDNLPWSKSVRDESLRENLMHASSALGHFNALGLKHGDSKIKNVAQTENGEVGMIDYETTSKFDINDPEQVKHTIFQDLQLFLHSLKKKGFFGRSGDLQPALLIQDVLDEIVTTYIEQWSNTSPEIQTVVTDTAVIVAETSFPGLPQASGYYNPTTNAKVA
jgi:hypothetical protein